MKSLKSIEKKRQKDSYVVSARDKVVIIVDDSDDKKLFDYRTKNELDGIMHSVSSYIANTFCYLCFCYKYSELYFLYQPGCEKIGNFLSS